MSKVFVILVVLALCLSSVTFAGEDGWKNLTWGMDSEKAKHIYCGAENRNSVIAPYYNSEYAVRTIFGKKGVSVTPSVHSSVFTDLNYISCGGENPIEFPIVYKDKVIGVVKDLSIIGFKDDKAVQDNIMSQLKSSFPSGKILTEKSGNGKRYNAFDYSSSQITVFNNASYLFLLSTNGVQALINDYKEVETQKQDTKKKNMKIF
jgi:hypothetical protein